MRLTGVGARNARAWIGTSGWNYKHWRSVFYPAGVSQKRWLGYYAERFDTVEINGSFYRVPTEPAVQEWNRQAPPEFLFAAKLWRGVTHYRKLRQCADLLERFFQSLKLLDAEHRGPLLVQLPPNQRKDVPKLTAFLADLRSVAGRGWRVVFEFRNDSWLAPDAFRALDRAGAALCLHDMIGAAPADQPNDAPFVYVRRHGPAGARYRGKYTRGQVEADAKRVRGWLRQGRDVFVYYNNDIGGHAVTNAIGLRKAVA